MATIVPPPAIACRPHTGLGLAIASFPLDPVISIAIAFLSSEEDSPLSQWHMLSGWIVAVLLVFRVVRGSSEANTAVLPTF